MAAAVTDYFQKVGKNTATTLSAPGYTTGNNSINVASTTNWPTDTGVTFAIDQTELVDGEYIRTSGTYNVFRGTVASGTQITNVTYVGGDANRNYSAGSTTRVYILVSADRDNRLVDGLLVSHDQDGTLKAGAVDNAAVLASDVVTTAKILNSNVTTAKIADSNVTTAKIADDAVTPVKINNTMRWSVYRNAALNSGNSGVAIISFDTENFDPGNIHSAGRVTATVAGDYQVNAASVMNTTDSFRIFIYKNGVTVASGSTANGTGVVTSGSQCAKLIRLAVGDYLEVFSFYNTAAQPLAVGDTNTYFTGFLMHDNT